MGGRQPPTCLRAARTGRRLTADGPNDNLQIIDRRSGMSNDQCQMSNQCPMTNEQVGDEPQISQITQTGVSVQRPAAESAGIGVICG